MSDLPLANKLICFTGTLQTMGREEARERAEMLGAKTTNSFSKKLDILVAGLDCGSKLDKARAAGITIYSENQWLMLMESFMVKD